jgi:hypothetical protein
MKWPQIPTDRSALSITDLLAFARSIKATATKELANVALSAEDQAEVAEYLAIRLALIDEANAKKAAAAALAALAADDTDEEPEPEPEPVVEAAADPEPESEPVVEAATAPSVKIPTTFGPATEVTPPVKGRITPGYLQAVDGVQGKQAGESFASWQELALSAVTRAESLRANADGRYPVAVINAKYAKDRQLTDSLSMNMAKFEPDEITAAFCAPATPYYDLHCANSLSRPVFNSLPQFQAPRGRVSVMSSPTLAAVTAGYGVWTDTDDDNANKTKDCATIVCGTPTEYKMYGVWRCLTVKNLIAMTYPELVEAHLNRLGAAHARLAEQTLLNAMFAGTTSIAAQRLGYGATTTILSTVLNYLALYQETQRWDGPGEMEAWAPRWVLWGIKMDLFRRRQLTSDVPRVATDAEIDALFRNVGVNIHWFMDTPSWSVAIPSVGASTLNLIPQTVQILVAPRGKFALIDRGQLQIGVTGNGMYRDNTSNSKNQFTFFFENFEGIVNTTSCPAHTIDIQTCWNGAQIDDIVINCQGGDEVGYQS